MTDLFDLTRKVALITGGAGGIGRAQALGLADVGADCADNDFVMQFEGEPRSAEHVIEAPGAIS